MIMLHVSLGMSGVNNCYNDSGFSFNCTFSNQLFTLVKKESLSIWDCIHEKGPNVINKNFLKGSKLTRAIEMYM